MRRGRGVKEQKMNPRKIGVALCVLAMSAGMPELALSAETRPICEQRRVVDYLRPFQGMPDVKPPPSSGKLPFAPPQLRIYQRSFTRVLAVGRTFGYGFSATSVPRRGFRLGWHVSFNVREVNVNGRVIKRFRSKARKLGVVHDVLAIDLSAQLPEKAGFYRYDITFRAINGRRLGSYSQYVRVVNPVFNARLRTNTNRYRPGEIIELQVVNRGTTPITYREHAEIKMYDGTSWVPVSWPRRQSPVFGREPILFAGQTGPCGYQLIPKGVAAAGRYRLETDTMTLFGQSLEKALIASFEVVL
jgi:hypothetical protein